MSVMRTNLDCGVFGELEANVEYTFRPGYPAYISGPPEDCYEGQDDEVEIETVIVFFGATWMNVTSLLNPETIEYLEQEIIERESDGDDEPEPDEDYVDEEGNLL